MAALKKFLILINVFLVLASTGIVVYSHIFLKPAPLVPSDEISSLEQEAYAEGEIQAFTLPKMVLNVYSKKTRLRHLDVEVNFLPFQADQLIYLKKHEDILADQVINVAGNIDHNELSSLSGKILLAERLKRSINAKLEKKIVKKVFFSRFVVQ